MTGPEFKERVIAVHRKHTGSETGHGALSWFGSWCGTGSAERPARSGRAVFDWTVYDVVPDGPHLTVLALLEVLPKGSRTLRAVLGELRGWAPQ